MDIRRNLKLILMLVLSVGLVLSCLVGWVFYDVEEKRIIGELAHEVDERAEALYREVEINFETLRSLAILFDGETLPEIDRFNLEARKFLNRYPAIMALEWVPRVSLAQRAAYEAERRLSFSRFEITERQPQGLMVRAGERAEYYPVDYLEPLKGNEIVLGFDLASSAVRREILEMARDTDTPQATANIALVQESENQNVFLAFLPIYKEVSTTVSMRRKNLMGFVLGAFRLCDMFDRSALSGEPVGIEIKVVDQSLSSGDEFVHVYEARSGFAGYEGIVYKKELPEIWGRKWALIASPTMNYIAEMRNILPVSIFASGIIFTLFIALYIHVVSERADIIQKVVIKKTAELNEANQRLEMISRTDGLTGIANRRFMDEFIDNEWLRAIRNQSSISLVLVDVDFFKLYNDNYGHLEGDEVLKRIADCLSRLGHRPGDLVARYGGEEFALVLSDTEDAEAVATNCRSAIEALRIPHEFSTVSDLVTISVGHCTVVPDVGTEPNRVLAAADKALYLAKRAGRNRVVQCGLDS